MSIVRAVQYFQEIKIRQFADAAVKISHIKKGEESIKESFKTYAAIERRS